MAAGVVTEILYQFAGYLHIYNETARVRLEYEDFAARKLSVGFDPTPDELGGQPHKLDAFGAARMPHYYADTKPASINDHFGADGDSFHYAPLDFPDYQQVVSAVQLPSPTLVGGGSVVAPEIKVSYGVGGNQHATQAQQANYLLDNDRFGVSDAANVPSYPGDIDAALEQMLVQAHAETPDHLSITEFDAGSLIHFMSEHHAAWKEEGETIKGQLEPGDYVNGVLQPEDAELPTEPETVENTISTDDAAQIATLGGNEAVNAAVIVDVNHATGTMVVVGDHFTTDAIVQVTLYSDDDSIHYAGSGNHTIETHGNEANNVASFLETDLGIPSFAGSNIFAGLNWHVDVFDGDLYDVHSIIQTNWLMDNDVSFQASYETHHQVLAGDNLQQNFAAFETFIGDYDLVIVLGDYNQANLIFQKIVLLDPDTLKVLGSATDPEGDEASGASISSGGNWLLNDAIIENYGTQSYNELTDDWEDLIESLEDQTDTLDVSAGFGIPNFGEETLDILMVTGSVYDINVVSQEIVVADADTALQLLPEAAEGEDVAQSASAGGNSLTNFAAIVHTGPAADYYIGGDHYDEDLLIQAEILASDNDSIIYEDPNALATELVAFTSPSDSDDEADSEEMDFTVKNDHAEGDLLGGTIT